MDLLQSFCKTGHVIFCNVFLHTVFKTQDLLQLSQPLCLTQLLAAILSPCKHLKMSSIPVFCIFWRHFALLLTPPFLGLKAPDMIQRFPFLVHLVHTVWLFLHDTPDFWGGQISDKTRIIWVASKLFIKENMSHYLKIVWHGSISQFHVHCVLPLLKNENLNVQIRQQYGAFWAAACFARLWMCTTLHLDWEPPDQIWSIISLSRLFMQIVWLFLQIIWLFMQIVW